MLLENESDLILVLGVIAAVLFALAIIAGIIAAFKVFQIRQFQELLFKAERKIDHLERRMFNVLNAVPVALVETDQTGKFTFANKAAHQLLGRKDSELIGLRFHSATWGISYPDGRMIPPDLLPIARTLRGQTVKGFQHLISNHGSQSKVLVSVTSMPIMNTVGEVIGSTTALVELETQTGEGIGDLSGVWRGQWFAAAPVPFWGLDQFGTVVDVNASACDTFEFRREQALGQNWAQAFATDADLQKVIDCVSELPLVPQGQLSHDPSTSIIVVLKGANGILKHALLTAWIVKTQDGAAQGLTVMAIPNELPLVAPLSLPSASSVVSPPPQSPSSDDMQALEDLKKAELARAALGVGVWQYDAESDSIIEDEGMRRLIGREFDGGPTLISDTDQALADQAFGALMSGASQELNLEFCVENKDGSRRFVALKGKANTPQNGGQREVFGVALDVTDAKEKAQKMLDQIIISEAPNDTNRLVTDLTDQLTETQGELDQALGVISELNSELAHLKAAPAFEPETLSFKSNGQSQTPVISLTTPQDKDLDSVIDLVRIWDKSAELTQLSKTWYELTGCGGQDFLGEAWLDTIIPDDQTKVHETLKALLSSQSGGQISYGLKTKDANLVTIVETLVPLKSAEGEFNGLKGYGFDISSYSQTSSHNLNGSEAQDAAYQALKAHTQSLELEVAQLQLDKANMETKAKRLDEALETAQRFETVGRLTGDVANDFAQMLNVINGALDMIGQKSENPDLKRLSEAALAAGKRGERLTRQLQAFTHQAQDKP
jgi:PAS domain-containing protein